MNSTKFATVTPSFNAERNRWCLPNPQFPRVINLFETEDKARDYKRIELARLVSCEKAFADWAAAEKAKADAHAVFLASFRGFLSLDPMKAGRQIQVLQRQFLFRGEAKTRKQIVEKLVSEGRTVTADGLENAEGAFLALGKTERAYATHLISLAPVNSPAAEAALATATI